MRRSVERMHRRVPGHKAQTVAATLFWACCLTLWAQNPLLLVTGLPCPGDQGELTNAHPLTWQCLSAQLPGNYRFWWNWQDTIPIGYGDVVSATWFGECRGHTNDWDFLRVDLVLTNADGSWSTNRSTLKMAAGENFCVSYIYWYTNQGVLWPTQYVVAQLPVAIGVNQTFVLDTPAEAQAPPLDPPLYEDATNVITDPRGWPVWASATGGYPDGPLWVTNQEGLRVVVPAAQVPMCSSTQPENDSVVFALHGLPGYYTAQTTSCLGGAWSDQTNFVVGPDGTGSVALPFDSQTNLFVRAKTSDPAALLGPAVLFQTLDSSIAAQASWDGGTSQHVLWSWSDGTSTLDASTVSKDFGSAGDRMQSLAMFPGDTLTSIDLGFDESDGGEQTPVPDWPPQSVGAIYFPTPLTNLQYFAADYAPITNTLDFRGFDRLQIIECYLCTNLPHAVVSNLPSLRRACFEQCNLQELDLSGMPQFEDLRAALNAYTNVVIGGGTGPNIWHWCTRDSAGVIQRFQDIMTNFFSLRELWVGGNNQDGALTLVTTNLVEVWAMNNYYSFADFSAQTNFQWCDLYLNSLTNVVLTDCTNLQHVDLNQNLLTTPVLDNLLSFFDTSVPNLEYLDLTSNAELPSEVGYSHYTNLVSRGVSVYVDWPPGQ